MNVTRPESQAQNMYVYIYIYIYIYTQVRTVARQYQVHMYILCHTVSYTSRHKYSQANSQTQPGTILSVVFYTCFCLACACYNMSHNWISTVLVKQLDTQAGTHSKTNSNVNTAIIARDSKTQLTMA